ncbi:MAG: hypothetical protein IPI67_23145 [Myxococcales bacterium]|nr:hypothetical protein [Myxococcales bacterium]
MSQRSRFGGRLALLVLAGVSLVAGAWAGLARIGVPLSPPNANTLAAHGGLMVSGVLGTLIGLERAVALDQRWAYSAPLATGLGAVAALAGADFRLVTASFAVGSSLFVVASVVVTLRQIAVHALVMLFGAVAFATGNLAWALGVPVARVVLLWAAFLVLTIGGERLELSRMLAPPASAVRALGVVVLALGVGSALSVVQPELGGRLTGASFVLLVAWLVRHDVARRTVRIPGLPRYAATSVLLGYVWLAVAGVMLLWLSPLSAGLLYDATLHALFLGFVFSMVFGHAPIILPAVLRVELPYARLFYLPLALLHGSVALRIAADLAGAPYLRQVGGTLNVLTLVTFALSIAIVKLRTRANGARHSHEMRTA